ncbi:MAG TPA: hypothetical protein DD429_12430 [Clostridiaceae bacterium]|jgi:hypothetical protein|nr:hypothetical protein [Clostridiaceae bacterium]
MIVIYHDIGGTHSSAVAANIHVNKLPWDDVPNKDALLSIPTFDRIEKKDWGRLIFMGKDEFGASVYTMCRQFAPMIVLPALTDIYNILNNTSGNEGLYLVNTSPTVNSLMAIGGFLSRRMKFVIVGRPIVTYGTLKAYKNIAGLVGKVKEQIKKDITSNPVN